VEGREEGKRKGEKMEDEIRKENKNANACQCAACCCVSGVSVYFYLSKLQVV